MTQEEQLLTAYAASDRDRRNGSTDALANQKSVSEELYQLGFYIIANRDNPEHPVFHLQPRSDPTTHHLYEVHG